MLLQFDEWTYIISAVNVDIENLVHKYADNEEKEDEWDYFMKTDGEIRDEFMSYEPNRI